MHAPARKQVHLHLHMRLQMHTHIHVQMHMCIHSRIYLRMRMLPTHNSATATAQRPPYSHARISFAPDRTCTPTRMHRRMPMRGCM